MSCTVVHDGSEGIKRQRDTVDSSYKTREGTNPLERVRGKAYWPEKGIYRPPDAVRGHVYSGVRVWCFLRDQEFYAVARPSDNIIKI
jgi:hypothetical protein